MSRRIEKKTTNCGETIFFGNGLSRVLSIIESVLRSWYWFNAEEPEASKNTPVRRGISEGDRLPEYTIKPVNVVAVTGNDIRIFERDPVIFRNSVKITPGFSSTLL